jgi:hypothetical protein
VARRPPTITTVYDAMHALNKGPLDVSEVSDEVLAYFSRPILPNLRGVERRGDFLYAPRSLRGATAQ